MSDLGYLALGFGLLVVYLAAMAAVLFGAAGTRSHLESPEASVRHLSMT